MSNKWGSSLSFLCASSHHQLLAADIFQKYRKHLQEHWTFDIQRLKNVEMLKCCLAAFLPMVLLSTPNQVVHEMIQNNISCQRFTASVLDCTLQQNPGQTKMSSPFRIRNQEKPTEDGKQKRQRLVPQAISLLITPTSSPPQRTKPPAWSTEDCSGSRSANLGEL